jgi:isoquinoline 1-oxidoreductase subunit beta
VETPYAVGDILVEYIRHESVIPGAFWRAVGTNPNLFSIESFLDLIARKTNVDPVAFRRGMLEKNPRALGVLNLVAEKERGGHRRRPRLSACGGDAASRLGMSSAATSRRSLTSR